MNKNELIEVLAEDCSMSKADANRAVDCIFDTITGALKKSDDVRLVGFGTFAAYRRKATTGRNPKTGEMMDIPASNQAKFRAGKALKETLNNR